ncbi:MAG: prolipoprotein diacylglyceryl transferase [Candidatus Eremiobacteraeota bacterium]|nr:prolipoprotein diacylglyceryl transferase [Candidatus Eremiobacteraeota bacterium]
MHPIAFKIGSFPIYFYGVMMVVAYVAVLLVMRFTRKFEGFSYDQAIDVTIFAIAGGVIGARLFYVALNLSVFIKSPLHIFFLREGGLSWHGALLGGLLGMLALHIFKKMPLGKICDFASVHIILGLAIGRIGCFLNGCCYGKITDVPWAVEFKGANLAGLRHPTQLYESFLLVITFLFMLWWWKRKKFDGEMTMLMFASYGAIRFFVEFFRSNTPNQYPRGSTLSLAQYFSLALFSIFTTIVIVKRKLIKGKSIPKNEEPGTII